MPGESPGGLAGCARDDRESLGSPGGGGGAVRRQGDVVAAKNRCWASGVGVVRRGRPAGKRFCSVALMAPPAAVVVPVGATRGP